MVRNSRSNFERCMFPSPGPPNSYTGAAGTVQGMMKTDPTSSPKVGLTPRSAYSKVDPQDGAHVNGCCFSQVKAQQAHPGQGHMSPPPYNSQPASHMANFQASMSGTAQFGGISTIPSPPTVLFNSSQAGMYPGFIDGSQVLSGGQSLGGQPLGGQPMGAQPLGGQPLGGQPLGGQPLGGQPLGGQPLGGQPLGGQPLGGQPLGGQPLGGQPLGGQPLGGQPLGGQPLGGQPLGGQPLGGQPLGGQPLGGQPLGGQPLGGQPLGGQPLGGQPLGGQPLGGQPMGGQPLGGQLSAQPRSQFTQFSPYQMSQGLSQTSAFSQPSLYGPPPHPPPGAAADLYQSISQYRIQVRDLPFQNGIFGDIAFLGSRGLWLIRTRENRGIFDRNPEKSRKFLQTVYEICLRTCLYMFTNISVLQTQLFII